MTAEQKPPQPPELVHDMRFDEERIDALKGPVGLAGDTVEITDYLGTEHLEDGIKHYMEYEDSNGDKKYTTLDQFVWMHLPVDRLEKLKETEIDPYYLDAGKDPILYEPEPGSDTAPTGVMSPEIRAVAQEAGRLGAREAVAELTGRRHTPNDRDDDTRPREPDVTPRNLQARIEHKAEAQDRGQDDEKIAREIKTDELEAKRTHLETLIPIASKIAHELNRRAIEDRQVKEKQQADEKQAKEESDNEDQKGSDAIRSVHSEYDPELTVSHHWRKLSKRSNFPRYGWNGPKKLKSVELEELTEGWLLARTVSTLGQNKMVQEVVLGKDGKLHAYVREGLLSTAADFLNRPQTRQQIDDSYKQQLVPTGGIVYVAAPAAELRNFHTITAKEQYPLPGVNEHLPHEHVFADPTVIQQGLEDLIVEKGLQYLFAEQRL